VTCDGRLFHRRAAATGNALSPTVNSRVGVLLIGIIIHLFIFLFFLFLLHFFTLLCSSCTTL